MPALSLSSGMRRHAALALFAGLALTLATVGCASTGARSSTVSALPTPAAQTIAIVTDRSQYRPSAVIGVTVQNVTGSTLFVVEQYSACTMLQLQRQVKGGWELVQPCEGGLLPQVRQLTPKVTFPLSFGPGNAPDNPNLWRPGTYRFAVAYSSRADGSNATAFGYSAGFAIVP